MTYEVFSKLCFIINGYSLLDFRNRTKIIEFAHSPHRKISKSTLAVLSNDGTPHSLSYKLLMPLVDNRSRRSLTVIRKALK